MDSPTGSSDRTLSAHDAVGNGGGNGDVTPKAENGHAKATKAAKAPSAAKHGSPPATTTAVGAHSSGDGSGTPQLMPSQPSSPAKFKNKPAGKL